MYYILALILSLIAPSGSCSMDMRLLAIAGSLGFQEDLV